MREDFYLTNKTKTGRQIDRQIEKTERERQRDRKRQKETERDRDSEKIFILPIERKQPYTQNILRQPMPENS